MKTRSAPRKASGMLLTKTRVLGLLSLMALLVLLAIPALTHGEDGSVPQFQLSMKNNIAGVRANDEATPEEQPVSSEETTETAGEILIAPMMEKEMFGYTVPDEYLATLGVKGERRYTNATSMLTQINNERAARGLKKLTMNPNYLAPAMKVAAEVSVDFGDDWGLRPNGEEFLDIYPAPWIGMTYAYINVAQVKPVVSGWMSDYVCRSILMDPSARSVGIGCFKLNDFYFYTFYASTATSAAAVMPANKVVTAPVQIITDFFTLTANPKTFTIQETKTKKVSAFANVPNWKKLPVSNSYMAFHTWHPQVVSIDAAGTVKGLQPGTAKVFIFPKDNVWVDCMTTATITQIKYTIKYYNGDTLVKSALVARNAKLPTSHAPAKTGHNFVGWYTAKTGGTLVEKCTKNQSVYARYAKKSYTVTYYDGATLITTGTVKYKNAPMAGPAKTGYTFAGWYTAASGGTKVTAITKSQSLYARYTIKQYTTNYYDGTKLLKTVKANYNTKLMAGPAKSGFRFDGWYTAATGGTQVTHFTANRSVYARYVKQVTVSYFTDYGALIEKVTVDINSAPDDSLAPGAPTPGMEFVGWYTAATGGTKVTVLTGNMNVFARYIESEPAGTFTENVSLAEILPE